MNIYAVPTLAQESIERPELTLIFNSDANSTTEINRVVVGAFNHLISEGQLKADGFSVFVRGYDKQEIPMYSLPLIDNSEIQRPNVIPFACNRYLSIDATYIEELTKKTQHQINFMSPLAFITQELSFDSMDQYINYHHKQRTVAAWMELLAESQAVIMGDYQAIESLLAQLPNITHENFKTTEVLAFTADNVFSHMNDIFMSNFVHHVLKEKAHNALVQHEQDGLYLLKYENVLNDGSINQDLLQKAYSEIKIMLQLSETSNNHITEVNQKVFTLHDQFFKSVTAHLTAPVSILNDQIVLAFDQNGSLVVKLQNQLLQSLHKQMS